MNGRENLEKIVVSAAQMQQIEEKIFAAGMPVPALMEKAALLMSERISHLYPLTEYLRVGLLVGPGHNGGDALVVARELYLQGYQVKICCPFHRLKPLTAQQAEYARSLGIPFQEDIVFLNDCALIIDGLFGFGLERSLSGMVAEVVETVNQWPQPVVSLDVPSGLHTDTGVVLGTGIRASHTLCLGLWKRLFFQDVALEYLGKTTRIDFGIPVAIIEEVLSPSARIQQMTKQQALSILPLSRPLVTHKYQQGHLLLVCGSDTYAGGAILTGLGARASGVGMLSIAVPKSLKPLLINHLPEALIIGCPETERGAIAELPEFISDLSQFTAVACGPGLTQEAQSVVKAVLQASCPLILDADGLNILAQLGTISRLSERANETVLTPHWGEFKRLFPHLLSPPSDRLSLVQMASQQSGAVVLLKGARTAIANADASVWVLGDSTPALARGGSGDVLTGLIGGLVAQIPTSSQGLAAVVATAAWWHAEAAIFGAKTRTELGVDAFTLAHLIHEQFIP